MKILRIFFVLFALEAGLAIVGTAWIPSAWAISNGGQSESLTSLTDARPLPSFKTLFLKLSGVVCLALLGIWALAKIKMGSQKQGVVGNVVRQFTQQLDRVTQRAAGAEKSIQLLSTYRFNQKQSLVVVQVFGRTLVLGLSPDSIHLVSQFGQASRHFEEDSQQSQELGTGMSGPDFTSILAQENFKPKASPSASFERKNQSVAEDLSQRGSLIPNVRSRVKSRLEGFKPL